MITLTNSKIFAINLACPKFTWHESKREWYAIIPKARTFIELIVRQSHGYPSDSFLRIRKVSMEIEKIN